MDARHPFWGKHKWNPDAGWSAAETPWIGLKCCFKEKYVLMERVSIVGIREVMTPRYADMEGRMMVMCMPFQGSSNRRASGAESRRRYGRQDTDAPDKAVDQL